MNASSVRTFLAMLIGFLLIWAGIKGNLGSMLAAFIAPSSLSAAAGNASTTGSTGA